MDFYQFKRGNALVCIGPNTAVCEVFSPRQFIQQFGGYLFYSDTETKQIYIGVWGARKVSRFRRLMREGGISYDLKLELPTSFRVGGSPGGKGDWLPKSQTAIS
jgi:hypothetical protein